VAVRLLLDRLQETSSGGEAPVAQQIWLEPRLIERASCAPPRR
jgi:DNA-binding LacI/PurR family transcriptional regulator